MKQSKKISLIIPVRDEAENLPILFLEIKKALNNLKADYEVIIIDDGSQDNSFEISKKELKKQKIKGLVIQLLSAYGKGAALELGFKKASGDIFITLDADLQDDPKEIKKFLNKIDAGYDGVVGWRKKRKDSFFNVISSKIFNFFTYLFTGVKLHDINCGLKAFKKEVISNIRVYKGLYRFLPTFVAWKKYKVTEIPVNHRKRRFGKSKYTAFKIIDGIFDLALVTFLVRFAMNPLRIYGFMGFILFGFGFIMASYLTVLRLMGQAIGRRPLLIFTAIFIIGGLQFISMGFLGELIRMNRPEESAYIIKEEKEIK